MLRQSLLAVATGCFLATRCCVSLHAPPGKVGPSTTTSMLGDCRGLDCVRNYVTMGDASFKWQKHEQTLSGVDRKTGMKWTGEVLNMTSQTWMSTKEVDRPVWWHLMVVIRPEKVESHAHNWANLVLGRMSSHFWAVPELDADLRSAVTMAVHTGATSAVLYQVPPVPFTFSDDPKPEKNDEDHVRAFSWHHAMVTQPERPEYLLELPMTKAIVRAMDTVTAFTSGMAQNFALVGLGKRTTPALMASALDDRVKAVVAASHSLDFRRTMKVAVESHNSIPLSLKQYEEHNIFEHMDSNEGQRLWEIVDPVHFTKHLTVPMLWVTAGNDDIFAPDHTQSWWWKLKGPKYHHVQANTGHNEKSSPGVAIAAANFVHRELLGIRAPPIRWRVNVSTGAIAVRQLTDSLPANVFLWSSHTCPHHTRRDFRLISSEEKTTCKKCGYWAGVCYDTNVVWKKTPLPAKKGFDGRAWTALVKPPEDGGYSAFFLEFEYDGFHLGPEPLVLATEISVVPNTYPFQRKS